MQRDRAPLLAPRTRLARHHHRRRPVRARHLQALPIFQEIGDRAGGAITLINIGAVHRSRGDLQAALDYYLQALPIFQEIGDRAGEATTLNNIGMVHDSRGDLQAALDYSQQALPIVREVGDRAGEAMTRYNIAMVHRGAGRLVEAVAELELVVALDEALQRPDLQADTAMLEQVRAELDQHRSGGGPDAERGE
jgi:tetratricopeptide (TPR) repeat protein